MYCASLLKGKRLVILVSNKSQRDEFGMKETIVMLNLSELMEEIEKLGTYRSEEEYLGAMIAITEQDNHPFQHC